MNNFVELISISMLITIIFSLLSFNPLLAFLILLVSLGFLFLNEKIFLILSVIIYISATGNQFQNIRNVFTIISLILLVILFFRKYGLYFKKFPKPPSLFIKLILILISSIAITTSFSGFNFYSLDALFRAVVFFSVCYLLYSFLEERYTLDNVYALVTGVFISSFILSITVYYDLIRSGFLLFIYDLLITRWAGAFGNPNTLAQIISMNIILLIVLYYSKIKSKWLKKLWIPLLLTNNILILILTNSRAAILSLIISIIVLFYFLNRKFLIYFFSFIVIFILFYLFEPFTQSLVDLYLRLETVSQREYLWSTAIAILKEYPFLGVGPELYPTKFYSYLPTSGSYFFDLYLMLQKPHPHNYSLWLITEMGIFGWLSAFSIFGFYFYMAWKLLLVTKSQKDEIYLFALGLFSIGILVFIRSFFEVEGIFSYGFISRDLPFWISYVILAYLYKNQSKIIIN